MLKRHILVPAIWIAILVFWALPALAEMIVDTAWVRRYNGPGDSTDYARAIAVDGSGNVYVTGYNLGSGTDRDYATIKYYPNGDTAWLKRYNGPGNSEDNAYAIAVDSSGNVYVAGYSDGTETYRDYATVKYYPNGDTAWVRRYNGPGIYNDWARAIAVDGSNNVYVTGWSDGSGTYADYVTIKYYPDGDTAWVRRYNGPGNYEDIAFAIAIDGSGNVFVTGRSEGIGTLVDYATIKYYPNGDTAWVRRYNGPGNSGDHALAIAVDGSGNVFVTGISLDSGTGDDYATVKYYSNGDTAWVRRYNGPGNSSDWAWAVALDDSGNVYVTGESGGSGTSYDYATIKYYSNGDTAWVRRYNGPGNYDDYAYAVTVDDSGNVYVTGESYDNVLYTDYATIKYDADGNEVWVERYNGPGNGWDRANAIAVDDSDNVYVTGPSDGIGTGLDYATIKYCQTLRGDVNRDGVIDIADVVYLINYLFIDGPAPEPLEAGDANCDGVVDIADVVYLINYLFIDGSPPCEP